MPHNFFTVVAKTSEMSVKNRLTILERNIGGGNQVNNMENPKQQVSDDTSNQGSSDEN